VRKRDLAISTIAAGLRFRGNPYRQPTATTPSSGAGYLAFGAEGIDVAARWRDIRFIENALYSQHTVDGKASAGGLRKGYCSEVLRRFTLSGGLKKIMEYSGPDCRTKYHRPLTIANMGAENLSDLRYSHPTIRQRVF
jgi:aconitase A